MKASDAFNENAPLPASALAALDFINRKDADLERLREALDRSVRALAYIGGWDVAGYAAHLPAAHVAKEALTHLGEAGFALEDFLHSVDASASIDSSREDR